MAVRSWIQIVLGGWLMVSPWLLGFSANAVLTWSNLLVGLALVLMNLWALYDRPDVASEKK